MTNPEGVGGAQGPAKVQLLADLGSCLAEWSRALSHGAQPSHPNMAWLRGFSAHLLPHFNAVGLGGIAAHLGELLRRVDAQGAAGDVREPLQALSHLSEQARRSLTLGEQAQLARAVSTPKAAGISAPAAPAASSPPGVGAPAVPMGKTMLGLRAFSARKSRVGSAGGQGALLGLERRAGGSGSASSSPPQLSDGAGGPRNVQELLGGLGRRSAQPRERSGTRDRKKVLQRRRAVAIAAAALVLVLGGLGTWVVMARRTEQRARAEAAAAAAAVAAQSADSQTSPAEVPQAHLTTEDETLRALLAQVHGRGKESAELKALVDEQAALAARAVKKGECQGSSAECQEWAKIRKTVLGQGAIKRIRRRAAGSPDRLQSRWLVGLKMPEIPIEDDPRVQRALEYYTDKPVGRELLQGMLFRCGAYRELIESTLIRYDLPIDLLAVVFTESGCQPQAVSPVGAAGLWQFMPTTARAYHLRVQEGVIDERRSPPKSTEAAVRFLRDLRQKFSAYDPKGFWDLVFGSYNMGPFGMAARVERAGGNVGFWDLVEADLLPDETAQYAPTIQAMALILNNLARFKFATVQIRAPEITSDLEVPPGTRLSLIARAASTSTQRVRSMNLDISSDRTPPIKKFAVQVPKDVVFQARDTLKALIASADKLDLCAPPSFDWGREQFTEKMAKACERKLKARRSPPKQ